MARKPRDKALFKDALSKKQKKAIKKEIKQAMDKENEFKQYSKSQALTGVYAGTAGSFLVNLTDLTQNTTDAGRVGDEMYLERIELLMNFTVGLGATSTEYCHFRVFVFQYKAHDDTPTISEMLLTSALNGGSDYGTYSSYNIDYKPTYHVLLDKTVRCEAGTPSANNYGTTGQITQHRRYIVPLKYCKRKIQFKTGATTQNNGIWMIVTTNLASVTSQPSVGYNVSVRYTDN